MISLLDTIANKVQESKEKKERRKFYRNLVQDCETQIYKGLELKLNGFTKTPFEHKSKMVDLPTMILQYKGYELHLKALSKVLYGGNECDIYFGSVWVHTEKNGVIPVLSFDGRNLDFLFPHAKITEIVNELFHNFVSISEEYISQQVEIRFNELELEHKFIDEKQGLYNDIINTVLPRNIYKTLTVWQHNKNIMVLDGKNIRLNMTYGEVPFSLVTSFNKNNGKVSLKLDTTILGTSITLIEYDETKKENWKLYYPTTEISKIAAEFLLYFDTNFNRIFENSIKELVAKQTELLKLLQ